MFTGIVQGRGKVREVVSRPGLATIKIELPPDTTSDLEIGASISVDGVCLTVATIDDSLVVFDVMQQTLNITTIGTLTCGDEVNIERSMHGGAEIGGHVLSGHIDACAEIVHIETPENNHVLHFQVTPDLMRYIFSKGFVALQGASLTVASLDRSSSQFSVWLIPETLRLTTFGSKKKGDKVNLEIDRTTQVIVDTVSAFLDQNLDAIISARKSL